MRNTLIFALLCGLVLMTTSTAHAQRGRGRGRGGVVMGPDGPLYDTRSPEWRMSGGNIFVYQELMEEKMELAQEKYMLQQMQQAAKLQKAQSRNKSKAKGQGPAGASNFTIPPGAGFDDPFAEPVNHYRRKKYKHGPSSAVSSKPSKPKSEPSKKSP